MQEVTELVVTVKNSEASYKQKFLFHDIYTVSSDDQVIRKCVKETLENSKIEPEDIQVRILLVIQ